MADDAFYLRREELSLGGVLEAEVRWEHPPTRKFFLGGWTELPRNGYFIDDKALFKMSNRE